MTADLSQLFGFAPHYLMPIFLIFVRIAGIVSLMPAFGEMMVPARIKLAAALAFTMVTAPAILPEMMADSALSRSMFALGLSELVTGLAIGLSLRLMLMALQIAATISAQSTSLAQLLGGAVIDPQPAIGFILLLAALALAAELGLHVQASVLIIQSYDLVGVGVALSGSDLGGWIVRAVSSTFSFAFKLATPFVAVSLLYNLALGVINRAMPQLMVAFVGAPAITFGALLLLALTAPLILTIWAEQFQLKLQSPFWVR